MFGENVSAKVISQKKFSKLVSSTGVLSQPPGSLPRLSNLLLTQRGSLQICNGSLAFNQFPAPYTNPLSISIFSNNQLGQNLYYEGLSQQGTATLADVTGFDVNLAPGTIHPAGPYTFGVVAIGSAGGGDHTSILAPSAQKFFFSAPAFDSLLATWNPVAGSYGYQIFHFLGGTQWELLGTVVGSGTTTFTFTGPFTGIPVATAPNANTTYYLGFFSAQGAGVLQLFAIYPCPLPQPASVVYGDPLFPPPPATPGFSPYGGLVGAADNIPTLVQFAGLEILVLGNGFSPQSFDPTTAAPPVALTNTFTAAYPTWQASVSWLTGSQVTDGAGNYYTATQGGVSGATAPAWSTSQGSLTPDGSVVWTSQGPIVATTAPRGAAHAVAYAGSLWLANTSPTNTSDGIDGPSCLKMSDSNNPNSWNPVNTAFIGRADGTQITGLQPFTIAALGISPTGSLCVFKEFTTYQVIGVFGSTSFDIQPAQTNLGCLAARSIQFLPGFGVVRYTHLGFAVFDGINDRLISEDIRPYLFGGVDSESDLTPIDPSYFYLSHSAQTTAPPMYLCAMPLAAPGGGTGTGQMTRLFCYDLVMKAWAVLDLPWAITSLGAMIGGEGYPLVVAGKTDGTLQRLQAGDLNWNQGAGAGQSPVQWSFRSPDLFGEGATQRLFFEQVTITGYGSAAMVQSLVARLWLDGTNLGAQAVDIVPTGDSTFTARVSIFRNGYRAHLDVSGNNGGAPGVIDSLDWAVVPKSALARRVIS